jgi:hypothetical protein
MPDNVILPSDFPMPASIDLERLQIRYIRLRVLFIAMLESYLGDVGDLSIKDYWEKELKEIEK